MSTLPLFNCPTTVAWIDDDSSFTGAGTYALKNEFLFNIFNSPQAALNYFETYQPALATLQFFRHCEDHEVYDSASRTPIELNISVLDDIREKQLIQNDISVLIVDFNMPGMNGIELCRKIKSLPMKKILLTGEVDDGSAVAAFNEGIIHRFLRKESMTLVEDIQLHLKTLSQEYLAHNTKGVSSYLSLNPNTPLSDPQFVDFFKAWCVQNTIREYYLADSQGTFITIDHNGNQSYFITHTDNSLEHFIDLNSDDNDVAALVKSAARRESIPFFGIKKEAWQFEPQTWNKHFFKPNIIEGLNRYYWATVSAE